MFNLSKRKSLAQQATILKRTNGVLTTHEKEAGFELNASLRPTNQSSMGVGNLPVTLDMNPTLSGFLFNKEEKLFKYWEDLINISISREQEAMPLLGEQEVYI